MTNHEESEFRQLLSFVPRFFDAAKAFLRESFNLGGSSAGDINVQDFGLLDIQLCIDQLKVKL